MHLIRSFIIAMLAASPFFALAQDSTNTARINFITNQYKLINSQLDGYRKITKDDATQSSQGGQVTAYFDGNALKEISATYYGDDFKETQEYCYYKQQLIFCYGIRYQYKMSIKINSHVKIASTSEDRLYFYKGKMINFSAAPSQTLSASQMKDATNQTLQEATRLLKLIAGRE